MFLCHFTAVISTPSVSRKEKEKDEPLVQNESENAAFLFYPRMVDEVRNQGVLWFTRTRPWPAVSSWSVHTLFFLSAKNQMTNSCLQLEVLELIYSLWKGHFAKDIFAENEEDGGNSRENWGLVVVKGLWKNRNYRSYPENKSSSSHMSWRDAENILLVVSNRVSVIK